MGFLRMNLLDPPPGTTTLALVGVSTARRAARSLPAKSNGLVALPIETAATGVPRPGPASDLRLGVECDEDELARGDGALGEWVVDVLDSSERRVRCTGVDPKPLLFMLLKLIGGSGRVGSWPELSLSSAPRATKLS